MTSPTKSRLWPSNWDHPVKVAWRTLWLVPTLISAAILCGFLSLKELQSPAQTWRELMRIG